MRLFGLIGYPLTHSFSKNYFTEKFKKEEIENCRYENFQIPDIEHLSEVLQSNPGLQGLNVTIPYKESVLSFLNEKTELVLQTAACNCIRIVDGKLTGHNTDVSGFEKVLLKNMRPGQNKALILGTGGASKAVAFVLTKNKIKYKIVSRQHLAGDLTYDRLSADDIGENEIIINTTPVGMFPDIHQFPPLPYEGITPNHFLFDLIYNPEKTQFLKKGEDRGALIRNGYEMLVNQAEDSWRIWNQ